MHTCYSSSDVDEAKGFQTHTIDKGRSLIPGLVSADLIADAGHTLMQEQPEVAAARLLAFLSTPHAESA